MSKKCALFGLAKDTNCGDRVILDCTAHLLGEYAKVEEIELCNMVYKRSWWLRTLLRPLKILGCKKAVIRLEGWYAMRQYLPLIEGSDFVVIAGGGLIKFKAQRLYLYVSGVVKAAEKLGKSVIINAVGIEGYDENDLRCQYLKATINRPNVKSITSRDDIATLQECYMTNADIHTEHVADPALFTPQTYGIERNMSATKVGVGLIRGKIFTDHGVNLGEQKLIELYISIIEELEQRGVEYTLFTNGLHADYLLAIKVLEQMGRTEEHYPILVPSSGAELAQIIANFSGVIASRMHATIIAYSLDIAAVGLVWNDKLSLFGKMIKTPERFLLVNSITAKQVVDSLLTAQQEGYTPHHRQELRHGIEKAFLMINADND